MKYDIDYFIKFFTKIPKKEWCSGMIKNGKEQHCALGHLGVKSTDQGYVYSDKALKFIDLLDISPLDFASYVNDSERLTEGKTPKARVLKYLRNLKRRRVWTQNTK